MEHITDIVVDINDFLVVVNVGKGIGFLAKSGGINLMARSVVRDSRFLMRKFFGSIQDVYTENLFSDQEIYFVDFKIPDIIVDHLLDLDSNENVLDKIRIHLGENASWIERNGLIAIADMSFNHDLFTTYRSYNAENLRLVELLSEYYCIHMMGNPSKITLQKLLDNDDSLIENISGNVLTSAELLALKCSKTLQYDIYQKFFEKTKLNPATTLFIETNQGYVDAVHNYGLQNGIKTNAILYQGKKAKEGFVKNLGKELHVDLDWEYIKGE